MDSGINSGRFGLAFDITGVLLFAGCAAVTFILGHDSTFRFFKTLLHGRNVPLISRINISAGIELLILMQTFFLSGLSAHVLQPYIM
jgi:hypothetical protein